MEDFVLEVSKVILVATVPVVVLIIGGQRLLNRHELNRHQNEQEISLARFIRERQYESVQDLYVLYARFMTLYRDINAPHTDLDRDDVRATLFHDAAEAEGEVDAAILRIGSEFTAGNIDDLEPLLGNLRQSVQVWRQRIGAGKRLPFSHSEQLDYLRFKAASSGTCAYMVNRIYESLDPPQTRIEEARRLLSGAASNKYEPDPARDDFLKHASF